MNESVAPMNSNGFFACYEFAKEVEVDGPKIVLDPGHGGDDPGAIGINGLKESDVTLHFTHRLCEQILARSDADVVLTHIGEGKSLANRCKCANDLDAALFISIHCNAYHDPSAHGFEAFTSRGETGADQVASKIYGRVSTAFPDWKMRTDWSDGDIDREAGYYVLKHTSMPAVLIELGFITNPSDHARLVDVGTFRELTRAVCFGIVDSL